ncbi:MAG TPA: SdrD B-like domain-containing protein, partial [Tepidisphaeraceae bacterium]|nr:SdrD B-like domain-containing protein [Tepidisphaeraceae bacterium]
WQFTAPHNSVSDSGSCNVTLSSSQPIAQNQDFGQLRLLSEYVSIKGKVFNDLNGNGQVDPGEPGLGFAIYVDLNNNGVFDSGEPISAPNVDGSYTILDLALGTYYLREILPAGWKETAPAASTGGQYYTVAISPNGTSATEYDFGNIRVAPVVSSGNGQIVGSVFDDSNGNGKRQKHEKALVGVQVYADLNGDGLFENNEPSATTDASGQYTIKGLGAGSVTVRAVPPAGWITTTSGGGLSAQLVTDTSTAKPAAIGLEQGATVTGLVLKDVKGKGHVNRKSPPMSGWRVFVDLNGDGVWQASEPSAVTDATGSYTISGLSAGKVELRLVPQSGWKQTTRKNNAPVLLRLALKKKAKAKPIGLQQLA